MIKQKLIEHLLKIKADPSIIEIKYLGLCYEVRRKLGFVAYALFDAQFKGHYPIKGDGATTPEFLFDTSTPEQRWSGIQLKQRLALIDEVVAKLENLKD